MWTGHGEQETLHSPGRGWAAPAPWSTVPTTRAWQTDSWPSSSREGSPEDGQQDRIKGPEGLSSPEGLSTLPHQLFTKIKISEALAFSRERREINTSYRSQKGCSSLL